MKFRVLIMLLLALSPALALVDPSLELEIPNAGFERQPITFGEPVRWLSNSSNFTTPPIRVSSIPSSTAAAWTRELLFWTSYDGTYRNITYTEEVPNDVNVQVIPDLPHHLTGNRLTITIPELIGRASIRVTGSYSDFADVSSYFDLPGLAHEPDFFRVTADGRVRINDEAQYNVTFHRDANGLITRVSWHHDYASDVAYEWEARPDPVAATEIESYLSLPNLTRKPLFYAESPEGRLLINDVPEYNVQFHQNDHGRYDLVTWIYRPEEGVSYAFDLQEIGESPGLRQLPAAIDRPVTWVRNVRNASRAILPAEAVNIRALRGAIVEDVERRIGNRSQEILLPTQADYEIEYETPPPEVQEEMTVTGKRIIVSSPFNYTNITAYASVPDVERRAIDFYWLRDGRRIDLPAEYKDTNDNGLIDRVEWVVPHLSTQTFIIELTILTVQSYPTVYGNWTVAFNASGRANLTIAGINGTRMNRDLEFLELRCEEEIVTTELAGDVVHVSDYMCNGTSYETSRVLTSGKHTLQFRFGNQTGYAFNLAGRPPDVILLSGASGDVDQTTDAVMSWSNEDRIATSSFTWQDDEISVLQDGVYRVSYGLYITTTGNSRYQALSHLAVDGSDSGACYASGYNRGTGSSQDLVAASECLVNLSAGQNLSILARRVSSDGTQGPALDPDRSWFHVQRVDTPNVLILREATGGDAYDTANITLTWDAIERNDSAFSYTLGSDGIGVTQDGLYRVSYAIGLNHNTNDRAAAFGHVQINRSGAYENTPYGWSHTNQRGGTNAREAALTASTILNLSSGDAIRLRIGRASELDPGDLTTVGGRISLDVEYLGPLGTADVLLVSDNTGLDDVNNAPFNVTFDNITIEGADFAYTPSTESFTVNRTGLYHLSYGVYTNRSSGTTRMEYLTTVLVNGAAADACWGAAYNRGDQSPYNSTEGGAESSCYLSLQDGDAVTLNVQKSSTGGNALPTTPRRIWLSVQSMDYGSYRPNVSNPNLNVSSPVEVFSTITMEATVTDIDSGIDTVLFEITHPNATRENATTSQGGTTYTNSSITLTRIGNYTFRVLSNDTAGFRNDTEYALTTNGTSVLLVVDRTDPVIGRTALNASGTVTKNTLVCVNVSGVSDTYAIDTVEAEYTNSNGFSFNKTMSDNATCAGALDDGIWGVEVTVGSVDGDFNYSAAHVYDTSGNIASNNTNIGLLVQGGTDTIAPTIIIESPSNTTYGTGAIDYNVSIDEPASTVFWSISGNRSMINDTLFHWINLSDEHPSLTEGQYTITYWANDTSGNNATAQMTFTVDLSPPLMSDISVNTTDLNLSDSVLLNATIVDDRSIISVVQFTVDGENLTPSGGPAYTYMHTPASRGTYNWTNIYATSVGGTNNTEPGLTYSVFAQTAFASLSISNSTPIRNSTILISARLLNETDDPIIGERVTFLLDGSPIGTNTTNATGNATLSWTIPLATVAGPHTIAAQYAENQSSHYRAAETSTGITIYAVTVIDDSFGNDSFPVQGEQITVNAHLRYDNGTDIEGEDINFFYRRQSDRQIFLFGSNTTNTTGWALVFVDLSPFPTGSYLLNYTYDGNDSRYLQPSSRGPRPAYLFEPYGVLSVNLTTNQSAVIQGGSLLMNATVTCDANDSQRCGDVKLTAQYFNRSLNCCGNWSYRRNYTISTTENVSEYQVELIVDTEQLQEECRLQADCADLRFTTDQNQLLPYYYLNGSTEHDCGGNETRIWVRVPEINISENVTIFMYYDNRLANDARNRSGTFSTSSLKGNFYVVDQTAATAPIEFISFDDGNNVSNGTGTITLNRSDIGTLGASEATPLQTLKPLYGESEDNQAGLPIMPISWSGTSFVTNMNRGTGDFNIVAPANDSTVTIYEVTGGTWSQYAQQVVSAGTHWNLSNLSTGAYRIDATSNILVTKSAAVNNQDFHPLYPAVRELWGTGSGNAFGACLNDSTTITVYGTDGLNDTIACDAGDTFTVSGGTAGAGRGHRLIADKPIGVHAQADGDGTEASPFLPPWEFATEFHLPDLHEYIAIVAPYAFTNCTRYDSSGVVRDSLLSNESHPPFPSKIRFDAGASGDSILCNRPVQAYYESDNTAEEVLYGHQANRQYNPAVSVVTGTETPIYANMPSGGIFATTDTNSYSCGEMYAGDTCTTTWRVDVSAETGSWRLAVEADSAYQEQPCNDSYSSITVTDGYGPSIAISNAPSNNSGATATTVNITFQASDDTAPASCTLLLNGSVNQSNASVSLDTDTTFTLANLAVGRYSWYINCTDGTAATNEGRSGTYYFDVFKASSFEGNTTDFSQVDTSNITNLVIDVTENGLVNFTAAVNLSGGADLDALVTITAASITVDSATEPRLNKSAALLIRGLTYDYLPVVLRNGLYCAPPTCVIESYQSGQLRFNVTHFTTYTAGTNSQLEIYDDSDPEGGGFGRAAGEQVGFFANYTNTTDGSAINGSNVNCSIRFNISGWTAYLNMSFNATSMLYEYNRSLPSNGTYEWNVVCNGTPLGYEALNATDNITIGVDFILEDYSISASDPIEGENVTFTVNVSSSGGADNVSLLFNITVWNGTAWNPDDSEERLLNFSAAETLTEVFWWLASLGTHNVSFTIDARGNFTESNESNNERYQNYTVNAWETFYGNVRHEFLLGDAADKRLQSWNATQPRGNLYFSDIDSSYDPLQLRALNGSDDLEQADAALGMTGFNDSIERLYDADGNGIPDATTTFTIFGLPVQNVPIIQSTSTDAFVTGILWDGGDPGAEYDATQDLVFVTKVNASQVGAYGTYDYEVRLPSPLSRLVAGTDAIEHQQEII